jgi:LTR polyprotein gag-polypeptide-like protein
MDATAHTDWMARDHEAWIQIAMSVQGQCLNAILDAKSRKECWDKLAAKLNGKGEGHVAYLMEEVFHGDLSKSEPMKPQIKKLLAAACNLKSLGFPLNEKVVAFAIVTSLPESLSMLKTVLYGAKGANLTINSITAQIYLDKTHCVHASGSSAITFFAKAAKKKRKSNNKDKKKCTHCKHKGHNISECHKLKQENEAKDSQSPTGQKALPATSTPKTSSTRLATADSFDSDEAITILTALMAYIQWARKVLQCLAILDYLHSGAIQCRNHT